MEPRSRPGLRTNTTAATIGHSRRGRAGPATTGTGDTSARADLGPAFGPELQRAAQKKLRLLNAATQLSSLRVPPGNRLEKLVGDRAGQHSIRINDQYRICFVWLDNGADEVEITDYH